MFELRNQDLRKVSGGAPTAAEAIQAGTALGAGVGASWVISAAAGTASGVVGAYGVGTLAIVGAGGAGLFAAWYVGKGIGTAINDIEWVNLRLGELVDSIFGPP